MSEPEYVMSLDGGMSAAACGFPLRAAQVADVLAVDIREHVIGELVYLAVRVQGIWFTLKCLQDRRSARRTIVNVRLYKGETP